MKIVMPVIFFMMSVMPVSIFGQPDKGDTFVSSLMNKMTVDEKIGQLNFQMGDMFVVSDAGKEIEGQLKQGLAGATGGFSIQIMKKYQEIAVNESRLGIPLLFGRDVIHGSHTIFPIPLALSSTWDVGLVEKSARIAAVEASSDGVCWTFSPMVDIARDPRWGRIAEGFGEDPWIASRMAEAMVKGYQGGDLSADDTIMACVKHFALYGAAESGRDYNTVDMSRISMFQNYFPPYKAAFDAGAGSGMSSFNVVDYVPATCNEWLLSSVLRDKWGFQGFVVSDAGSLAETVIHGMGDLKTVSARALTAGLDMDMGSRGFIGTLKQSLSEGRISREDIDRACFRILKAKYELGLFEDPYKYLNEERAASDLFKPENIETARYIADRSIVLLKNSDSILPLKKAGTIAVIGPLADDRLGVLGTWAFIDKPERVVSVFEGIKKAAGEKAKVVYAKGANATDDPTLSGQKSPFEIFGAFKSVEEIIPSETLMEEAIGVATGSDVIVAVLGEPSAWSGEAASRSDISIPKIQKELLASLLATGKPLVLVLVNGRPMTIPWEDENVPAIIEAWHGGMQAGNAIADVLFGDYNPSGKLTTTFPRSVGQIPIYYNHLPTGRPVKDDEKFTSRYLDITNEPLYPFGYGLSYTTFEYGDIQLSKTEVSGGEKLTAGVTVTNTGQMEGEEVVQLYINDPTASISRPVKELKGFQKIMLQPGEKKEVNFTITAEQLMFYNGDFDRIWEPGEFNIYIGTNSRDVKSAKVNWTQ